MKAPSGVSLTGRLDELYRFERSAMRPGLAGVERLLEMAGRPDRSFPSVLVAGTNGKGSTAAHLASILRASGLRIGLYTSPHISRFNERIRVQGRELSDEDLEGLLSRWWPRFTATRPSFFEATTALCFDHFASSRLDLAVVEVGLGGRLDATNVLSPLLSVITTISSDHQEILGRTLGRIASEKAGVIKPGGRLVCGVRGSEARAAIVAAVRERGATVDWLGRSARYATRSVGTEGTALILKTASYSGIVRTPLAGRHQARNAALAALAAERVLEGKPSEAIAAAIERGIGATRWPARAELVLENPPTLVDVAHNAEGARALAETVSAIFPDRPVAFVVALSHDKAHEEFLSRLGRVAARFYLTQFAGERATSAEALLAAAPRRHITCEAIAALPDAIGRALAWARGTDGAVVVAGSFFLASEALPVLGATVPDAL